MTAFLKQVASHYYERGRIDKCCFVLPNKRSRSFLKKYINEEVAAHSSVPVLAPECISIDELFYKATSSVKTDRTRLLIELYGQYSRLNNKAESLDEFIFWGDILLADFDDVDKYLVDAEQIFRNISELKDMQDEMEYLSDKQKEAVDRLMGHFSKGAVDEDKPKGRFLKIWNILLPLYHKFNEALRDKSMSYEGMVYRELASRLDDEAAVDILQEHFPEAETFVFVGLNALNECEKKLMRKLRDAGKAEFCWDYVSDMIRCKDNKSSFFMQQNADEFPSAFDLDEEKGQTIFNTLSVASGVGQAKQLGELLSRVKPDGAAGIETAIVLADEGLLLPALNSIPNDVETLNVTMGYPIKGSACWDLIRSMSALQMHIREEDGRFLFYYKNVYEIFSNSLVRSAGGVETEARMTNIRKEKKYYIPAEDLAGDPLLALIFTPVVKDAAKAGSIDRIAEYQKNVISAVAAGILACESKDEMLLELDFCKLLIQNISRIEQCQLEIKPATYFRLLIQLIAGTSVPFEGEPLNGLQLMGPLETRALDFDNIIILGCNEGMFPRRSVSSSFIPAELRKGFDLPTYEYQDAVWAYYFYRLIQRAKNVWMVYDSRSGGLKCGEESRYIKQLELHFKKEIRHYSLNSVISANTDKTEIPKTQEHIDIIKGKRLSASGIKAFLSCPAKFYYSAVEGLKEDDQISESLDNRMIGSVFHDVMRKLYGSAASFDVHQLDDMRKDEKKIRELCEDSIKLFLKCKDIRGRNIIFTDMICEYVFKSLERDIELLKDNKSQRFNIIALEKEFDAELFGYKFKGFIDRLDSYADNMLRVVDYKTGKVHKNELLIDDGNYEKVLNKIRAPKDSDRNEVALQMYIYDKLIACNPDFSGKDLYNSVYQCSGLFDGKIICSAVCRNFIKEMDKVLEEILNEIGDLERNWERTSMIDNCKYCPFRNLCTR